jgi:two-component system, NtrC family, sensor kinase
MTPKPSSHRDRRKFVQPPAKRVSATALRQRVAELEAQLTEAQNRADLAARQIAELESQRMVYREFHAATPDARLSILLAISAALMVTHEIDAIMHLIVYEGMKLFPGTTGALLFLPDQNAQRLVLRAASPQHATGLTVLPGQGPAGRAFLAPRAMLLVGPELELALAGLDQEQLTHVERLIDPWPPTSVLLAPLRLEGQRLGALVIYGGTYAHLFHPRDLAFVQGLADLAAVAIVERRERERAMALQHDLAQTRSLHAEAQSRLDAAQAQLLQSAKLAAVGELAASVAHEINNPLYAARNSLYLVEQDLPPGAQERTFLEIAQNELGRIARIITRMRDFYRPARAELLPTDVNDVLLETLELVQTHLRHGQVAVVADLAPALPPIVAHADQLRQVFLNLMLNACDAMSNGGTLRVMTGLLPPLDGRLAAIAIRVADTGTGIAPEHLAHLFEPFYTTKPQGTGLGLAISMHIVTQHGGNITPQSTVGAGTTFTVTLPVGPPTGVMPSDPAV